MIIPGQEQTITMIQSLLQDHNLASPDYHSIINDFIFTSLCLNVIYMCVYVFLNLNQILEIKGLVFKIYSFYFYKLWLRFQTKNCYGMPL